MFRVASGFIAAGVLGVGACAGASPKDDPRSEGLAPHPPGPGAPTPAPAESSSTEPLARVRIIPGSSPVRYRVGDADALDRFVLDVPLPSDSGECHRGAGLNPGEQLVVVYHPSRANAVALASVLIAADSQFVQFLDRRGGLQFRGVPGGTRAQQDSAILAFHQRVRRSSIRLDYRTGQAWLLNQGGGRPDDGLIVPLHLVARHARFGAPDLRAREVIARCR